MCYFSKVEHRDAAKNNIQRERERERERDTHTQRQREREREREREQNTNKTNFLEYIHTRARTHTHTHARARTHTRASAPRIHARTHTHLHTQRPEAEEDSSAARRTRQVCWFGKIYILRFDLRESRESFYRRGKRKSQQAEGPKTENTRGPTVESLVRGIWRLRVSEAERRVRKFE